MKPLAILCWIFFLFHYYSFAQQQEPFNGNYQSIVAADAKLEQIADGFAFTEGPAADKEGNVYFTDQPNDRIWVYQIDGTLRIFMENTGRSNGLYVDRHNDLIACADENNQLWRITKGKVEKLVTHYQDTLLNGPNDVWVAPNGFIYFTDPYYQRSYWERQEADMQVEALYLYKPNGALSRLDENFKRPNGLIGTADGKYLYVADIGDDKTYRYSVKKDGTLHDKVLFVSQGSDGMTLDAKGNLYLTGNGITVYDKRGSKIAHLSVPSKWTANICFGGKSKDILFITASDKIFTLKMKVKGAKY